MADFLIIFLTLGINLAGLLVFGNSAPLFLAVVLLPFSDTNLIPRQLFGLTGVNPFNITVVIGLFFFFLRWVKDPQSIRLPRVPVVFAVYLLMIAAGACAGLFSIERIPPIPSPRAGIIHMTAEKYLIEQFLKPVLILVVSFLAGVAFLNDKKAKSIFWAMAIGLSLLSLVIFSFIALEGIDFKVLADSRSREFLSWVGMHANELGLMLNIGIALLFFSAARAQTMASRLLLAVPVTIGGISSLLTFSRAAFAGLGLILVYYLISRRRFREIAIGLCILGAITLAIPKEIYDRATTGFQRMDISEISAGRFDRIWMPLIPIFLESPIYGNGLASTLWSEPNRKARLALIGHPHSAYLSTLLDFGLLGACVIGFLFYTIWKRFRRLAKSHPDGLWRGYFEGASVALLVLLVQGLTDDRFIPSYTQAFFWLAVGLSWGTGVSPAPIRALSSAGDKGQGGGGREAE